MDDFLTPVATIRPGEKSPIKPVQEVKQTTQSRNPTSPEDALKTLRSEPEYDSLMSVLRYLSRSQQPELAGFDIRRPSPISAQLVQVLVSETVPSYWAIMKEDSPTTKHSTQGLLLSCLRSITGINSVLERLRATIHDSARSNGKRSHLSLELAVLLELLHNLLKDHDCVLGIWKSATAGTDKRGRLRPIEQELLALFGSGKIISLAAEAETLVRDGSSKTDADGYWTGNALRYTRWIGENIVAAFLSESASDIAKFFSGLFAKALGLGHSEVLIRKLLTSLHLEQGADSAKFVMLLDGLAATEQRKVLFSVLKLLSADFLDRLGLCDSDESKRLISAVAGAIAPIVWECQTRRRHITEWLTGPTGAGLGEGIGIRRAVLAVVSQDKEAVLGVLEKSISQFGDQLYIKHSPILQQEAHTQVLLLSAGYVHRALPFKLTMLMRSSGWLNAISNRLSALHLRARFLGMVVGEALSGIVDKSDKRLDFKMDDTISREGRWYKGLIEVADHISSLDPLVKFRPASQPAKKSSHAVPAKRPSPQPPKPGFIIEELSEEEIADDDIVPFGKPDSDDEDSDDDPTLVRRNKPKPPVYVRDLIRYLRDTENYDHQKLALSTAAPLIRRKANYGTEIAEHAEELASLLIGLQNKYEIENFDDLKLQGMIAVVGAQPKIMGPWFAKTFFDGDYSVSQRASVLVVLGLCGRELAGFETSEFAVAASFPSKTLPEQVERLFIGATPPGYTSSTSSLKPLPPNSLDNMARSITSDLLAPLAATAADAATGPDVLKLSTFTSRLGEGGNLNVKIKSRTRPRVRAIPNTTAQLLFSSFFSPLTARFQAALHSSASRTRGIVFQPYLLALYIKTLALLLHAAGPSTLALPDMTAEFWGLLLSTRVRAQAVGDLSVTQALLFGFLAVLDVNGDRMRDICRDMGKEVVETQQWVSAVFRELRGGDGGDEDQVKTMAAGVLVRLDEGVEKYRLLMVGDLIGFGQ